MDGFTPICVCEEDYTCPYCFNNVTRFIGHHKDGTLQCGCCYNKFYLWEAL